MSEKGPVDLSPKGLGAYESRDYGLDKYNKSEAPKTEKEAKLDALEREYEYLSKEVADKVKIRVWYPHQTNKPVIPNEGKILVGDGFAYHKTETADLGERVVQIAALERNKQSLDETIVLIDKMKEVLEQIRRVNEDKE